MSAVAPVFGLNGCGCTSHGPGSAVVGRPRRACSPRMMLTHVRRKCYARIKHEQRTIALSPEADVP